MGMPIINKCTITREVAVGNIIESIAMEERALAHILNAESEKIMVVVNNQATTAAELMAINRSVKNTVNSIIRLEMQLKAKLDMFSDVICQK